MRAFCKEHGITYQSFWTLTGNPKLLKSQPVAELAQVAQVSLPTALYALVMDLGVEVLNGTTSLEHMQEDLLGISKAREWATANSRTWVELTTAFAKLVELGA